MRLDRPDLLPPLINLQQQLLILIMSIVNLLVAAKADSLQFSYIAGSNSSAGNLVFSGSIQFTNTAMWMLYDPASPIATNNQIWRVAYHQPVMFTSDSSFNTSFTFQTFVTGQGQNVDCPSGLAFFISPDGATPPDNSGGRYFGLVNPDTINATTNSITDPFVAVVFDGHKDYAPGVNDPSESYIGIDISSLIPTTFVDTTSNNSHYFPQLYLCSNSTFTVWISYTASLQTIQVFMTNTTTFNISDASPILTHKTNLWSVLNQSSAWYVGLSATNYKAGSPPTRFAIYSWHFSADHTGYNIANAATLNLKLIVPLISAIFAAIASISSYVIYRRMRQTASGRDPNIKIQAAVANLQRFSYRDLKASTHGFDPNTSLIGEGGYSKVYRGTLPDGSVVAIKRLKDSLRKEGEFISEVQIISSIKHRNLLQLEGWSYEKGEALLVYKFMSNGSLDRYLFHDKKGTLDGDKRLKILQGIAAALEYLHSSLGECILHRDIKAANVMLTENLEAVLGDFGLARLTKHNESLSGTMAGTPGYIAPEVFLTAKVTDKSDVYSFGVLMLEMACGSPAIDKSPEVENANLVEWISGLQSSGDVLQGLDPTILVLCSHPSLISQVEEQWKNVMQLALMCCHPSPNSRPPMRYVNEYIQYVINSPWPLPSITLNLLNTVISIP